MIMVQSFWITNASKFNVTLADLALNIKSYTTVNLLDKKHYKYTIEQLQKSSISGSLFKKRDKIMIRNLAPIINKEQISIQAQNIDIVAKERSIFNIKEEKYEELQISDDDYIKEDFELLSTIKKE